MFGSALLDVALGMIFVYLLLSLICTAANEVIEGILKNRALDLERGLRELLDPNGAITQDSMVAKLYNHPLVNGLYKGTYAGFVSHMGNAAPVRWLRRVFDSPELPSYIPSRNFALALMDTVLPAAASATSAGGTKTAATSSGAAGATPPAGQVPATVVVTTAPVAAQAAPAANPLQPLRDALGKLTTSQTQKALLVLLDAAGNDANKARENIETWFNSSMDRVSGWYKRRAQTIILILGFAIAVAVNADSLVLLKELSKDKTLREALVASAEGYAKANAALPSGSSDGIDRISQNLEKIKQLQLPIGWLDESDDLLRKWPGWCFRGEGGWFEQFYRHWLGWLITALAVSLGAPFWFDLLNKIIVVRSTIKPHEKSPEEKPK